jgi:hypothetical protein
MALENVRSSGLVFVIPVSIWILNGIRIGLPLVFVTSLGRDWPDALQPVRSASVGQPAFLKIRGIVIYSASAVMPVKDVTIMFRPHRRLALPKPLRASVSTPPAFKRLPMRLRDDTCPRASCGSFATSRSRRVACRCPAVPETAGNRLHLPARDLTTE